MEGSVFFAGGVLLNKFKPVRVAVKEGEVGGHEVWPALHPHGQLGGEVSLSAGDQRQQVISEIQTNSYTVQNSAVMLMLHHLYCQFQTL